MEIKNISERASYVEKENELSLVVVANNDRSKVFNVSLLLTLWLIGGSVVVWNYFGMTDEKTKIMTLVWIAFWLYFTYVMVKALLWLWKGREILKFRNGELFYKKDTSGRGWVSSFPLDKIKNVKAKEQKDGSWLKKFGADYWSTDCDCITFECEEKETAIGYNLNEKEVSKIVFFLKNYRR